MTEWTLIGGDPAPGSAADVEDLAQSLRTVARRAVGVQQSLHRTAESGLSSVWDGRSAEAFALQMETLPEMSDKVFRSFSTAGQAMLSYASKLEQLQSRARACLERARQAESDLNSAHTAKESAITSFERQAEADGLNSVERWFGRREIGGDYGGRVALAENELEAERREARFIREDHQRAIEAAVRGIQEAREQGVRNAIRFSLFGIAPLGENFTLRDMATVSSESFDRLKPAMVVASALIFVVVTAGAGTPLIATIGIGLTSANVANTSTKMLRKGTGGELDESWSELGIELSFDLAALGASKYAATRGKDLALQRMRGNTSAQLARRHEISALRNARLGPPLTALNRYSLSNGFKQMATNRALQHQILIRDLPRLEQLQRTAWTIERGWDFIGLTDDYFELRNEGRVPDAMLTNCTGQIRLGLVAP